MDISQNAILHIIQNDDFLPATCVTELESTRNTRRNDSIWTHIFSKCWVILKPPDLPDIIMDAFKLAISIKIGPIGELKTTCIKQCLERCLFIEGVHFFGRKWCEAMTHISSSRTMFSHGRYYASHPATQSSMAEQIEELSPEMICSRKKASIQCGISTWQSWVRVGFFQFKSSRRSVISDFKSSCKSKD